MKQKTVSEMLQLVIRELRENKQWGTAHVYQSTYKSFTLYNKERQPLLSELTPALLKGYELFLRQRQCSWNTVSTYMKAIKATYNRAVDCGYVAFVPRLFSRVATSATSERKRALEKDEMARLMRCVEPGMPTSPLSASQRRTLRLFLLMFQLRGIPFVDLAYLRKSDIRGNVLTYRRRKTGRKLTVELTPESVDLIGLLTDNDSSSPYLFPFLSSPEGTEAAYREYQCALRRFNHQLASLAGELGGTLSLSTYAARHTWATLAYYCEVHPGIISEAMGHSSLTVTETYLKPFRNERIDQANRQVIAFAKGYVG